MKKIQELKWFFFISQTVLFLLTETFQQTNVLGPSYTSTRDMQYGHSLYVLFFCDHNGVKLGCESVEVSQRCDCTRNV